MRKHHHWLSPLAGAVLAWLCCGVVAPAQPHPETCPPPVGAGIVATLHPDQALYICQPAGMWCPPCVTDWPPCMLPCYVIEEKTAVARFTLEVINLYDLPRTFQFASGQQCDFEIIDEAGHIVAAWSDGRFFTQELTSFTLGPGQTARFIADLPLKDRDGQQLNGIYRVRAFLTTCGPQPRVEAATQIVVTFGY